MMILRDFKGLRRRYQGEGKRNVFVPFPPFSCVSHSDSIYLTISFYQLLCYARFLNKKSWPGTTSPGQHPQFLCQKMPIPVLPVPAAQSHATAPDDRYHEKVPG